MAASSETNENPIVLCFSKQQSSGFGLRGDKGSATAPKLDLHDFDFVQLIFSSRYA